MACASSGCQTGCCKDEEVKEPIVTLPTNNQNHPNICIKCKSNNGAVACDGGQFCSDCFRNSLYGKFKLAVSSHGMISPSDNILVAFSGGPSSRVALQFVHDMQQKAQKNLDASGDRSLPVFTVGVAFVDEAAISSVSCQEVEQVIQDLQVIVSSLAPPKKELHIAKIENLFFTNSDEGRDRLRELLNSVGDLTGKEDLVLHLRMLFLQKIASENGYSKLVLGSCTSRVACHVISATVKGQGYSLPADIQYVDARSDIPVVFPLRDCLRQELVTLCRIKCLKTNEVLIQPCSGINALVSSFVRKLQEENASRERTIVRTAEKLTPFHFNSIPDTEDCNVQLASQRRKKKYNIKSHESWPPESLCPICNSPLNKRESVNISSSGKCLTTADMFRTTCCSSCQFQILPNKSTSVERFYSLLPQPMISRAEDQNGGNICWLREQIQDCLLSEDEDGS